MRMPPRLAPLLECGVIDRVVRSLLSGKEAQVFLVESDGELRAAKVYKDLTERSFRNRASYTEGRAVRNSRDRRAMAKGSRHGRDRAEETWKSAEADTIYKLSDAGVRVPKPHAFIDGVLVMELIEGADGGPAPRLADCPLDPARADAWFDQLISEVVRMLCADIVHGDLSVYNILIGEEGPVIIDFPQAVDAAGNSNARAILLRDVANLTSHFKRGRPRNELRYGYEMWDLYERGELTPDTELTGRFDLPSHEVDAEALLLHMREVEEDEVLGDDGEASLNSGPRRKRKRGAAPGAKQQSTRGPEIVVRGKPSASAGRTGTATAPKIDPGEQGGASAKKKRRRRSRRGGRGNSNASGGKSDRGKRDGAP